MSTKMYYSLACVVLILAIGAGCTGTPGTPGIEKVLGDGSDSQPGSADGGQQIPGQPGGGVEQSGDWITLTDLQFDFSITYPKIYVILDEIERLTNLSPDLVLRVRFMEADLAKGPTADIEIPAFSIEIFENPSVIPLNSWISSNTPSDSSLEGIKVDGVQCTRVTLMSLQAPNEFVFCSTDKYVYKFTLVGPYSQEMLESFKFNP